MFTGLEPAAARPCHHRAVAASVCAHLALLAALVFHSPQVIKFVPQSLAAFSGDRSYRIFYLERGDHAGDRAAVACGILEQFLDRGVETLAQQAEQLAVVLEAKAEHLGDGDDVLAHGEVAKDFFVDVLGKEQGALLVA